MLRLLPPAGATGFNRRGAKKLQIREMGCSYSLRLPSACASLSSIVKPSLPAVSCDSDIHWSSFFYLVCRSSKWTFVYFTFFLSTSWLKANKVRCHLLVEAYLHIVGHSIGSNSELSILPKGKETCWLNTQPFDWKATAPPHSHTHPRWTQHVTLSLNTEIIWIQS